MSVWSLNGFRVAEQAASTKSNTYSSHIMWDLITGHFGPTVDPSSLNGIYTANHHYVAFIKGRTLQLGPHFLDTYKFI